MAEAHDARELVEEPTDDEFFPLNKLPNDLIVSVFEAVGDLRWVRWPYWESHPTWVRHTFPLVCKDWAALFRSKDASPLHETLELNFKREAERAAAAAGRKGRRVPYRGDPGYPVVQASRVISWAERRSGSVRKLHLAGGSQVAFQDFTATDFGALVAVVGPSLTEISIADGVSALCKRPFWESLRTSVVPSRRLRSFAVEGVDANSCGPEFEPLLGQLAGSLEELMFVSGERGDLRGPRARGLPRFPESVCALTELRRLVLVGYSQITAIPAGISSLKKLKELDLRWCRLSSLPEELGELSGLTKLDLAYNESLSSLPEDEAFPAELGKMKSLQDLSFSRCRLRAVPSFISELKSLRELDFSGCGLRTVPAFVGELKSLESLSLRSNDVSSLPKELGELSGLTKLDLAYNANLGTALPAAEAFPAELGQMKSLRELKLSECGLRTVPSFVGELESLEDLYLSGNNPLPIDAPLDFLIEGCPRLRSVELRGRRERTPEELAHLEAFKAKLRAKNPDAKVTY